MRHLTLLAIIAVIAFSCNQSKKGSGSQEEKSEEKTEVKKAAEPEEKEMTVELYCDINNEVRALLMEKYWEQLKDKSFEEVKDIYAKYQEEEDGIYEKYGIEDKLEMGHFFRANFKEIGEYQKSNPDFVDYPEYDEAKKQLVSLAMNNVGE